MNNTVSGTRQLPAASERLGYSSNKASAVPQNCRIFWLSPTLCLG